MAMSMAETKKFTNPRVEIDTSPPFESVKDAVNLFGGRRGPWIPHQLLPDHHDPGALDMDKMEEHTAQLERVLISRERETLNVLRELEEAKKLVEGLKVHLHPNITPESHLSVPPPEKSPEMLNLFPARPPRLDLMDFDQARMNINRTTIDLAVIRASVESLNKMMRKERGLLERSNDTKVLNSPGVFSAEENQITSTTMREIVRKEEPGNGPGNSDDIPDEPSPFKFEAEQYKKMVEASRYEVMKAMSEIERTKASIRMAEMRLNAAKKIEEAAKAVEAIAFAEGKSPRLNGENPFEADHFHKPEEIALPFEEYNVLSYKTRQAEEMCKTKFMDANGVQENNRARQNSEPGFKDFDQTTKGTYKKNSLEAAFDNEGGFHRREFVEDGFDGQRSDHRKMQYTGYGSAASRFRDSHTSIDQKDSSLLNRNESNNAKDEAVPVYRSTISIGDVLSRKLILQDDMVVEKHVEAQGERQEVSLSQMLREQSGLILHHTKSMKDGSTDRHFFSQKKRFGFIHVVLPKHNKKKSQVLN